MNPYNRLNPLHWLMALCSNSRKIDYTPPDVAYRYSGKPPATQRLLYWLRNPAHDFTHYIIGFEGDPDFYTITGNAVDTLRPGWIFALRRRHWLILPYVAYQGRVLFYAGWRPTGGVGVKLRHG